MFFFQRYSDSEEQRAAWARHEQTGGAGYPGQPLSRARGQLEAVWAGGERVRGPEASLQQQSEAASGHCSEWRPCEAESAARDQHERRPWSQSASGGEHQWRSEAQPPAWCQYQWRPDEAADS